MKAVAYRALTLAIHPSSRGFGWAAFEGPFSPFDWGTVDARGAHKNETCLRNIEKLLKRLTPEVVVLETFEARGSSRRNRITRLGRAIVALAAAQSIDVAIYPFKDVRQCFTHLGGHSRWEIACVIARQFTAFGHLLPNKRRPWDSEHWRLALFSAVALVLTHYQLNALSILVDVADGGHVELLY